MSASRLCRLADVSVRRFLENRADSDELGRSECVVDANEGGLVEGDK